MNRVNRKRTFKFSDEYYKKLGSLRGERNGNDCIFCRIIAGEIPSERVYEDYKMIVIRDVAPAAPVHVLMIPKAHTENIITAEPELLLYMLGKLRNWLRNLVLMKKGFASLPIPVMMEQTVKHMHIHLLGGKALGGHPADTLTKGLS